MRSHSLLPCVVVAILSIPMTSAALSAKSAPISSAEVHHSITPLGESTDESFYGSSGMTSTTTVSLTTTSTSTKTCKPNATVTVTTDLTITVVAQPTNAASVQGVTNFSPSCIPTVTELVTDFIFVTVRGTPSKQASASTEPTQSLTSTVYSTKATITVQKSAGVSSANIASVNPSYSKSGPDKEATTSSMSPASFTSLVGSFSTNFWTNAASLSLSESISPFIGPTMSPVLSSLPGEGTTTVYVGSTTETVTVIRTNHSSTAPPASVSWSDNSTTTTSTMYTNSSTTSMSSSSVTPIFTLSSITPTAAASNSTTLPAAGNSTTLPPLSTSTSTSTATETSASLCYDSNINKPTPCTTSSDSLGNGPAYSGAITSTLASANPNTGHQPFRMGWLGYFAVALATEMVFLLF